MLHLSRKIKKEQLVCYFCHMFQNTETYRSFQLEIGPGAYKRAFLTHRNAVTTAVKRVAGMFCKQRLLEQESWVTARNSVDMLQKVPGDCEKGEKEQEAMEIGLKKRRRGNLERNENLIVIVFENLN